MYLDHFRLRELPFGITPDTSYFMNRAGYQDALNVLLVALRSGEGFVKVTGEVGTGKTLLARKLLNTLGEGFVTGYIPNPYLKPATLLLAIADELGVDYPPTIGQHALLKRLNQALLGHYDQGRRVVVCLDEVQAMPVETLETLRLLSNLETEKNKLMQVVLFGQPELDQVLEEPSVRQLRQRITFAYQLLPLNRVALGAYVRHRLTVAGHDGPELFSRPALELLFRASRGIPRLANILAHKSLMAAYGQGAARVGRAHMRTAVQDTADARQGAAPLSRRRPGHWLGWLYGGALGLVLLGAVVGAGVAVPQVLGWTP